MISVIGLGNGASKIVEKFKPHGFYLTGIESRIEGACSIYKLERKKL